ncbi:MAG: hypothetical protein Q4A78_10095 [Peptostreptococcaceae bacterium]|nr:hypothetical protein [Peptostreptococcaceae bacterium]
MEEVLREEIRQIWLQKREGAITDEECRKQTAELIHRVLEESPQRLIDLCKGHIGGLTEEQLLAKARKDPYDLAFMNISSGSYYYREIVRKPPHPHSRTIKQIYRTILGILGFDEDAAKKILKKTSGYDAYNAAPAETILDLLTDRNICACLDWKFALEDVEYNLNLVAQKLHMKPIREYPPYEEGQPLGVEALEAIIAESEHSAAIVCDGDETLVFLGSEQQARAVKAELDKLEEFWNMDGVFLIP